MADSTHYVTYYVAPQQRGRHLGFSLEEGHELTPHEQAQRKAVQDFVLDKNPQAQIVETFIEMPDSRRTAKWPQLQRALESCKRHQATLVIAELGTLTSNESFTQLLLESQIKFLCMDQPFVNQTILEALSKHAQVQRKLHGKLIREGLKMTSAKSGNPNAAEVISKVNKPKIDTAIVFAFLLQPIIQDYRRRGFSQRQMVKTLNDEGFTAPEGGKWVLSQLQKVLDRVRLNEIALEARPVLDNLAANPHANTIDRLVEALNAKGISSIKRGPWDEQQAKKLQDRVQQIQDIVHINLFVLELLPILHNFRNQNLSTQQILKEIKLAGIPIHQGTAPLSSPSNAHLSKECRTMLEKLRQLFLSSPEGTRSLDSALESAAKHIPAYVKIVKGHIEQLAKVLELETHDHRKLDAVSLAEPVTQLMHLFRELDEKDLDLLENLNYEVRHWQEENQSQAQQHVELATSA